MGLDVGGIHRAISYTEPANTASTNVELTQVQTQKQKRVRISQGHNTQGSFQAAFLLSVPQSLFLLRKWASDGI